MDRHHSPFFVECTGMNNGHNAKTPLKVVKKRIPGISRFPAGPLLGALLLALFLYTPKAAFSQEDDGGNDVQAAYRAVVRITTIGFNFSYVTPWQSPNLNRSGGTGFIIEGNRIITNAHVVSQAGSIKVRRPNQGTEYDARITYIAHDCDLAMLEVDEKEFFRDSLPLKIGNPPRLNSPVVVIGFPIGGEQVSITRGIVSRLGMDVYSHSQIDAHKVIQVDAAINPGNSGGPALQNGSVIGIAFQVYRQGQNLGYLIPPEVINKFIKDVGDGTYDGYIDFGTLEIGTTNPILRRALGLEAALVDPASGIHEPNTGVLIYSIIPGSSADGYLRPGDILLSINNSPITHQGEITLNGQMQAYSELIDNVGHGSMIGVEIWRDGKRRHLSFPARRASIYDFQRINYDTPPDFYLTGGLLFQPLNANLFLTYARKWAAEGHSDVLYRYRYYIYHRLYRQSAIDVVLTRRLSDPMNLYADSFLHGIVESVNGTRVRDFTHFVQMIDRIITTEKFLVLRFRNRFTPLVLRTADLKTSGQILRKYGIPEDRRIARRSKPVKKGGNMNKNVDPDNMPGIRGGALRK